jgi:valyl-tRNA synthetase
MIAPWPKADVNLDDADAEEEMALVQEVVTAVRNIRGEMNIEMKKKVGLIANAGDRTELVEKLKSIIVDQARLDGFEIRKSGEVPTFAAPAVVEGIDLFVLLAGAIDPKAEEARLAKAIARLDGLIDGIQKKIGNENFVKNAPEELVIEQRGKLLEYEAERGKLREALRRLREMGV